MGYLSSGPGALLMPPPGKSLDYSQLNDATTAALAGWRNKLINGDFRIWQRGTSLAAATGFNYLADRWQDASAGSTIAPSQQAFALGQTAVPGEPTFFHRSVVASVAGAANMARFQQNIEGVRTLAGQQATLSFWAKADAAKNIAVEFAQAFGGGGSPSAIVQGIGVTTLALTTAWQQFKVSVAIPSITGKTLGTDGTDLLAVRIWFDAGSNFSAITGNLGQQSGTFDIARVQLEVGTIATPFEQRPVGLELLLAYRYYQRFTGLPASASRWCVTQCFSTTQCEGAIQLMTPMRANPSCNYSAAADFFVQNAAGTALAATAVLLTNTQPMILVRFTVAGGLVAGNAAAVVSANPNGWIDASAEL